MLSFFWENLGFGKLSESTKQRLETDCSVVGKDDRGTLELNSPTTRNGKALRKHNWVEQKFVPGLHK